ncbi:hypothetical protein LOK49_LG08G01591 [Camellia lanceoleosa]|uniref:Uncharacterized protein n=1 Tax=Camellia lanceoleosa TaxID=1840588 RepID=A0ACC0GRU8_9ERIC|nr:hypothetical protein LOK49_LG08G01591 [Camellia lanceoleosa]
MLLRSIFIVATQKQQKHGDLMACLKSIDDKFDLNSHQIHQIELVIDTLQRISVGGPCESVPIVAPCLSSWGEEEITEREKREKELGGYGCGEVIYKERCHGMELVVDRAQPDDLLVREVDTIVEHGLDFADEGNSTKEDSNKWRNCYGGGKRGSNEWGNYYRGGTDCFMWFKKWSNLFSACSCLGIIINF